MLRYQYFQYKISQDIKTAIYMMLSSPPDLGMGTYLSVQNKQFISEYKIMDKFQKLSNPKHNTPLSALFSINSFSSIEFCLFPWLIKKIQYSALLIMKMT
jgi:hypothetical protein